MLTAVNAPISLPNFNLGSMNYVLAHVCTESPGYLTNNKKGVRKPGFTILDNGADELGSGMTGSDLSDLLYEIEPDELILPDVLGDWDATKEASLTFWERLRERPSSLMGVAQGTTRAEWMTAFYFWNNFPHIQTIGIPYDIPFSVYGENDPGLHKSIQWAKNRFDLLTSLSCLSEGFVKKKIHLLGMNTLGELRRYHWDWSPLLYPHIRSTDTTAPFAAANVGRKWMDGESGLKDWPSLNFHKGEFEVRDLITNLVAYFMACGDHQAMHNLLVATSEDTLPKFLHGSLEYNATRYDLRSVPQREETLDLDFITITDKFK